MYNIYEEELLSFTLLLLAVGSTWTHCKQVASMLAAVSDLSCGQ